MNKQYKILVACECSQVVMSAFLRHGCDSYSCDIMPAYGEYPDRHFQADAIEILYSQNWDLVIAHPPCTYLSKADSNLFYRYNAINIERYYKMLKGVEFFMKFYQYDKSPIAIENPIPKHICNLPPYQQIISPHQFGSTFRKSTCLWLKSLPLLLPTHCPVTKPISIMAQYRSQKKRSQFDPYLAEAMAIQWIDYLNSIHKNTPIYFLIDD